MTLIHNTQPLSLVACDICRRVVLANHYGEPPHDWLHGPYPGMSLDDDGLPRAYLSACSRCAEDTMTAKYGYVHDDAVAADINYPQPVVPAGEWAADDWRLNDIAERDRREGLWQGTGEELLGNRQHEYRQRICEAWPSESFGEIVGKLEMTARHSDDGRLYGLVAALIAAGEALAAATDGL